MFNLNKLLNNKNKYQTLSALLMIVFLIIFGVISILKSNLKTTDTVVESNLNHYEYKDKIDKLLSKLKILLDDTRATVSSDKFNFGNIYSYTEPSITFGEKLYNDIKSKNDSLTYEITAKGLTSPGDLINETKKDRNLYCAYNPEDSSHIKNRQSSWRINNFTMVNINFLDNDGNKIEYYQNIFDILSMANLYTYYHNIYDYNAFEEYCNKLLIDSYTVDFDLSDIYFCSGCMRYDDKNVIEHANEVKELFYKQSPDAFKQAFPKVKLSHNQLYKYEEIEDLNKEPLGDIEEDDEDVVIEQTPQEVVKEIYVQNSDINQQTLEEYLDAVKNNNFIYDSKYKTLNLNYCPGHIDLNANVIITNLNNKRGLASIDAIGNNEENFNENWNGWTLYNIKKAKILSHSDWFKDYGINVSKIQLVEPLSIEEINYYMRKLPENISRNRYKIIKTALESVGKIPYYFGGKPYGPNYNINHFGRILTRPDHRGRILRGLDCSGWISWVYDTSINKDLNAEGTPHLAVTGVGIRRKNLEPGDVAVKVKDGSHVVMFLAWANDGKMIAIHENAGADNVSTGEIEAYYPYYRNLLLTPTE